MAHTKPPRGPVPARRKALERAWGDGLPPLGIPYFGGRLGRGVSKGGNPGGGRVARPCALSRPTCMTSREGGGRGAAQGAGSHLSRATARRRGSRCCSPSSPAESEEAPAGADRPFSSQASRHRGAGRQCPQARRLARARRAVDVCKPAGRCPCITFAEEMEPLDSCATDAPATRRRAEGGRGSRGGTDCPRG